MIDERELVRRAVEALAPPEPSFERLLRRRDRKERNRRLSAGGIAIVLALVSLVALTRAFRTCRASRGRTHAEAPRHLLGGRRLDRLRQRGRDLRGGSGAPG